MLTSKTELCLVFRRVFTGILLAVCGLSLARADIVFTEVTNSMGISYVGPSWGAAWGDFNGDGLPDLWTSNHQEAESLYINQGNAFVDIAADVVPPTAGDTHGAAWGDFDNDGDQDLIQLADGGSGTEGNTLLVNQNSVTFLDEAVARGVFNPLSRGRTPLWFDYNNDGRLDLLVTSSVRVTDPQPYNILFRQDGEQFTEVNSLVGLDSTKSTHYVAISDLTMDGTMEMLTRTDRFPETIYEISEIPFAVLSTIAPTPSVVDAAIADFNGDLRPDIYYVHGVVANEALQVGDFLIESHMTAASGTEMGLDITIDGDLNIQFSPAYQFYLNDVPVNVGAGGYQLFGAQPISLSNSDPANFGLAPHASGIDFGIYIGYEPESNLWSIRLSSIVFPLNLEISTTTAIEDLSAVGFNINGLPKDDVLLMATANGYVDQSASAGIDSPNWGRSVVAADFDNDMDLDIYIVATGQTRNRDNILYENDGTGVFSAVANAGGAAGHPQGRGDAVALADYDRDGYVDIFVTNGKSQPPWDQDGPVQLFRNAGGDNKWLELDLQGTVSNRDGIGAKVQLTAGGVSQLREQNGGIHYRAQNHQRIHFGLGSNETAELLSIRWPSGRMQELRNVAANQILTIVEPPAPICEPSPWKPGLLPGPDTPLNPGCDVAGLPIGNDVRPVVAPIRPSGNRRVDRKSGRRVTK